MRRRKVRLRWEGCRRWHRDDKQMNHPTIGRIPSGGHVERSLAFDFNRLAPVSLLLREADFSTAGEISQAINRAFGREVASARDGGRVEFNPEETGSKILRRSWRRSRTW